jgi:hypothetical protein
MPPEMLICRGLIFSDLVIKDVNTGKLSLINCFSNLNAPGFPFQGPMFFVTALVSGISAGVKTIPFSLSIIEKESGERIFNVEGHISTQGAGNMDEIAEVIWVIPPLIYSRVGVYDVILTTGGQELDSRSLFVRATTGPQLQIK